jgi:hypothetical protein
MNNPGPGKIFGDDLRAMPVALGAAPWGSRGRILPYPGGSTVGNIVAHLRRILFHLPEAIFNQITDADQTA